MVWSSVGRDSRHGGDDISESIRVSEQAVGVVLERSLQVLSLQGEISGYSTWVMSET